MEEFPDSLAKRMLNTLVMKTINDITSTQMSRIIDRVRRMSSGEREAPAKVAWALANEIGAEKALDYVEKALANGLISTTQYNEMRSTLLLHIPRERLPAPWAALQREQLLKQEKEMRRMVSTLTEAGQEVLRAPVRALEKDIQRLRRSWGSLR